MAKEIKNVGCPFCAWNRFLKDEPRFDRIDPSKVKVLSARRSIGRIKGAKKFGFKIISVVKLKELLEEYKKQIRNQCRKILTEVGE